MDVQGVNVRWVDRCSDDEDDVTMVIQIAHQYGSTMGIRINDGDTNQRWEYESTMVIWINNGDTNQRWGYGSTMGMVIDEKDVRERRDREHVQRAINENQNY